MFLFDAALIIKDYHSAKKAASFIICNVILPYAHKEKKMLTEPNISTVKLKPKFIFVLFQLLETCEWLEVRRNEELIKNV